MTAHDQRSSKLSATDIRHIIGAVSDETIAALEKLGASAAEMEIGVLHVSGEGDRLDREGHPLAGRVRQICSILEQDELYAEE